MNKKIVPKLKLEECYLYDEENNIYTQNLYESTDNVLYKINLFQPYVIESNTRNWIQKLLQHEKEFTYDNTLLETKINNLYNNYYIAEIFDHPLVKKYLTDRGYDSIILKCSHHDKLIKPIRENSIIGKENLTPEYPFTMTLIGEYNTCYHHPPRPTFDPPYDGYFEKRDKLINEWINQFVQPIEKLKQKFDSLQLENEIENIKGTKSLTVYYNIHRYHEIKDMGIPYGYYVSNIPSINKALDGKHAQLINLFPIIFSPKYGEDVTAEVGNKSLYHLCPQEVYCKIKSRGLRPNTKSKIESHPERIYLLTRMDTVLGLLNNSKFTDKVEKMCLLVVNTMGLPIRLFADPTMINAVYTFEDIPPEYINLVATYDVESKQKINESMNEVNAEDINLSSFRIQPELNPKIFPNGNKLKPKVRLRLIELAHDFIDFLDVDFAKPKDIVIVGSMVGYQWSKYSDIDLHIVYDFKDISERTVFVREYMDSKKLLWNSERKIKIYGYEVECYVEDIKEPPYSNGRYSIENNEWMEEPSANPPIQWQKYHIKEKSAKIMDIIDSYEIEFEENKGNDEELAKLCQKADKLWSKIKAMRKSSLTNNSDLAIGDIIFKVLRRSDYLSKLYNLKNQLYIYKKSLFELKAKDVTTNMGYKEPTPDPFKKDKLTHIDGTTFMNETVAEKFGNIYKK
jgi:hypothetical protein